MADVAARREARRKRILENSENRLQRITGGITSVREDKSRVLEARENQKDETDVVLDKNASPDPSKPENAIFDKTCLEDEDFLTNSLSSNLRKRNVDRSEELSSVDDVLHNLTSHTLRNERFSSLDQRQTNTSNNDTNEDSVQDANPHDSSQRSLTQTSLSYTLFASKWALVILAALVNLFTISQVQYIYGKELHVPVSFSSHKLSASKRNREIPICDGNKAQMLPKNHFHDLSCKRGYWSSWSTCLGNHNERYSRYDKYEDRYPGVQLGLWKWFFGNICALFPLQIGFSLFLLLAEGLWTSPVWVLLLGAVDLFYIIEFLHTNILAPFFALMLVRLQLGDSKYGSQGGSMLSAALLLCNMKPELVYNLRWVMRMLKKITEEFAVYIFSFVIFYNVACSYWHDIDITISTTIDSGNDKEF